MNYELNLKEELLKGDYKNEDTDEYIKILEAGSKKNRILRIGIVTTYTLLIVLSLLIV